MNTVNPIEVENLRRVFTRRAPRKLPWQRNRGAKGNGLSATGNVNSNGNGGNSRPKTTVAVDGISFEILLRLHSCRIASFDAARPMP